MWLTTAYQLVLILPLILLNGCGGGSSSSGEGSIPPTNHDQPQDDSTILIGVFDDNAVQGIGYKTNTQSGTTN